MPFPNWQDKNDCGKDNFPLWSPAMIAEPFDRAALRAYIARHHLTQPEMAAHAGIPFRTLHGILKDEFRKLTPKTRAAIEHAINLPPPAIERKLPAHADEISRLWPKYGSTLIARKLGITPVRVRQIAKALGLGQPDRPRQSIIE